VPGANNPLTLLYLNCVFTPTFYHTSTVYVGFTILVATFYMGAYTFSVGPFVRSLFVRPFVCPLHVVNATSMGSLAR